MHCLNWHWETIHISISIPSWYILIAKYATWWSSWEVSQIAEQWTEQRIAYFSKLLFSGFSQEMIKKAELIICVTHYLHSVPFYYDSGILGGILKYSFLRFPPWGMLTIEPQFKRHYLYQHVIHQWSDSSAHLHGPLALVFFLEKNNNKSKMYENI
jgi:hypothetical protein